MKKTAFHRYISTLMINRGYDGGIKELSRLTGIKYRTLWSRTDNPRELREYEVIAIEDALNMKDNEVREMRISIRDS